MPLIVCNGGKCECSHGSQSSALSASVQNTAKIDGQNCATKDDYAFESGAFGICKVLTARNSGVATSCQPAVSAPWVQSQSPLVANGHHLLSDTATNVCQEGGKISISQAGQVAANLTGRTSRKPAERIAQFETDSHRAQIPFATGKANITHNDQLVSWAQQRAEDVAQKKRDLEANQYIEVVVVGKASSLGDPGSNYDLSRKRAEAVREILVKAGMDPKLLVLDIRGEPAISSLSSEFDQDNLAEDRVCWVLIRVREHSVASRLQKLLQERRDQLKSDIRRGETNTREMAKVLAKPIREQIHMLENPLGPEPTSEDFGSQAKEVMKDAGKCAKAVAKEDVVDIVKKCGKYVAGPTIEAAIGNQAGEVSQARSRLYHAISEAFAHAADPSYVPDTRMSSQQLHVYADALQRFQRLTELQLYQMSVYLVNHYGQCGVDLSYGQFGENSLLQINYELNGSLISSAFSSFFNTQSYYKYKGGR